MCRARTSLAVLITGLLSAGAPAADLKPWKHGVIEPKGDAGFVLMVGTRDFGARHGLKIETVPLKNGAIAHKALLAGELDSVESSPGGSIIAGARGADIKIAGCTWSVVPQGLMVRSTVKTIEDLKGKTVAVAAPGSLPNLLINAILEKYKISPSDVHFASLGGDLDRFKALTSGIVDGAVVASEFLPGAPADIRMLVESDVTVPDYVRLCLTMTGKTLSERRDDAVNFVAAEMDALRYALTHRDETIALTHAATHVKPDDGRAAFVFDDAIKRKAIDPSAPLPLDKLNWLQNELVKAGNLKTPIDLAKITDAGIRDEAVKRALK